jgi:RNA polymerase sigma-70 factor (ECF subfamily)
MGLLQRCQANDQAAWRELFADRAGQIYRWAVLLGLEPAEAQDAAQEVLATAVRRIRACRAEEALTSWLYQITRRVAANHRTGSWLRRRLSTRTPQDECAAFRHQDARDLVYELEARRCLRQLPEELAEILVMMEVVGLTRLEVAALLEIPEGTVASRLRRARAAFLELWQQDAVAVAAEPQEESR